MSQLGTRPVRVEPCREPPGDHPVGVLDNGDVGGRDGDGGGPGGAGAAEAKLAFQGFPALLALLAIIGVVLDDVEQGPVYVNRLWRRSFAATEDSS